MNVLTQYALSYVAITFFIYISIKQGQDNTGNDMHGVQENFNSKAESHSKESNLFAKVFTTFSLVFIIITFSSITSEWNRMTSELVDEADDPHYGLPDLWDGKQVVCFHFPSDNVPSGLEDGRHHFDFDGIDFKTDKEWNGTGGCVGGFENYDNGLNLLNAAVEATGSTFSLNITEFSFGLQIDTIGGVSPCVAFTCAEDFSSGAYWEVLHNGGYSMVGISDIELDDNSVITWRIASY
jgi:Ca2+/Na+ antiporter|tara:strand:- start:1317 stop:2030 length:714 start_codon:yes stop_codon:yes gene_type:complete